MVVLFKFVSNCEIWCLFTYLENQSFQLSVNSNLKIIQEI